MCQKNKLKATDVGLIRESIHTYPQPPQRSESSSPQWIPGCWQFAYGPLFLQLQRKVDPPLDAEYHPQGHRCCVYDSVMDLKVHY